MPIVISGTPTETIGLELDPDGSSVDLNDGSLYRLIGLDMPEPPLKSIYAGNFDTEGSLPAAEHGYENREITLTLLVFAADPVSLRALISTLNEKEGRINDEQNGVLRVTLPDDVAIDFDLVEAKATGPLRHEFFTHSRTEITLTFIAKPFWRGTEVDLGTFSELTLPCLTAVLPAIAGDVPALGRMVVTDLSGSDQWWIRWGRQSRFYDAAATAALFYQAESRTPLGGAATAVGATGASGAGSNVVRQGTLTLAMQAMLSTQASGGGAHLTHVGSFEVLARLYMPATNDGAVSVAWEWAAGGFTRREVNDTIDFDAGHGREGQFAIVRLGQVHIPEGSGRWEGQIVASSTVVNDVLDVDWLAFVPITEGSGELSAIQRFDTSAVFSARDEFDQSAGALTGKTLPVGGTWTGAGDADDFAVEGSGQTAQRTATSDSTSTLDGRYAIAGTPVLTNTVVQIDAKTSNVVEAGAPFMRLLARYTDGNNWLGAAVVGDDPTNVGYLVAKRVAGSYTSLTEQVEIPDLDATAWITLRLLVDASGRWHFWAFPQGTRMGAPIATGQDADLAAGGALDDGKVGFYDSNFTATAATRNYDNFMASAPAPDAGIFASQSLTLTHEGATREDSTGTFPVSLSSVEGDYLRLAPAGREGRVNRLVVKTSRNDPETLPDPGIDDLQIQVFATPRGVSIPAP